jgi:hypothetical protein
VHATGMVQLCEWNGLITCGGGIQIWKDGTRKSLQHVLKSKEFENMTDQGEYVQVQAHDDKIWAMTCTSTKLITGSSDGLMIWDDITSTLQEQEIVKEKERVEGYC